MIYGDLIEPSHLMVQDILVVVDDYLTASWIHLLIDRSLYEFVQFCSCGGIQYNKQVKRV